MGETPRAGVGDTAAVETDHSGVDPLRWALLASGLLPHEGPEASAPSLDAVRLGGGNDSLTYVVRGLDRAVVVKLNRLGMQAEADALRFWRAHTTSVPHVLGVGPVPFTGDPPLKYLVLGALVDDEGDLVETAMDHLARSPNDARAIGSELGSVLGSMHAAPCGGGFGNFADSPGAERTYPSWASYLQDFFRQHSEKLRTWGFTDRRIRDASTFISRCGQADRPRCLHGDVSIRNVAVRGCEPLTVGLLDPNPLRGDVSWDIAPLINNVEFNRRRHGGTDQPSEELRRDEDVLAGFRQSYPHSVDAAALLSSRLVQAMLQAEHRQELVSDGHGDDLDVVVTHEVVGEIMERMSR